MVKKKIALLLSVIMLIGLMVPMQSYAAQDKGLENALKIVRSLFEIPEGFKFDYQMGSYDGQTVWHLNWRDDLGIDGNVFVSIVEDGEILSYERFDPNMYDSYDLKKFPKVSRKEAQKTAEEFIKKVNPEAAAQVILREDAVVKRIGDAQHYFNFIRNVNGAPFPANNISVGINCETGEVQNYYYNWTKDVEFSDSEGAISISEAESAYKKELGLELMYKYTIENDKVRAFAVYSPKYYNHSFALDAITGKRVQVDAYYGIIYDDGYVVQEKAAAPVGGNGREEVFLTPEELEAVEKISKLMTEEQAEKIARGIKEFDIASDYVLSHSYLSRGWPARDDFNWSLSFSNEPSKGSASMGEDYFYKYINVTVDAISGKIKGFYTSEPYTEKKPVYSREAARSKVEEFIKKIALEEYNQSEYAEQYNDAYYRMPQEEQRYYNFRFTRKVNGIAFPSNSISVGFDAVNGKVTSYNLEWFNTEFPSLENVIDLEEAYKTLFDKVGLELQYSQVFNPEGSGSEAALKMSSIGSAVTPQKANLVYVLKQDKPHDIDAVSNKVIGYDGKEYRDSTTPEYTDIDSTFAKNEILALAEYGISFEGNQFKPTENITQKDFLVLLSKVNGYYYGPQIDSQSSEREVNEFYNWFFREGIVKPGEKAPDSYLTREESVKYLIRSLKYDNVADIQGIFKSIFVDEDKMDPELVGYIAIAKGLNIINGNNGYFYPKNNLTRAEAAVVIYNHLSR